MNRDAGKLVWSGHATGGEGDFRHSPGFAYRPSRQWVIKVNYEKNQITNEAPDRGDVTGWLGSVGFVF